MYLVYRRYSCTEIIYFLFYLHRMFAAWINCPLQNKYQTLKNLLACVVTLYVTIA